MPYRSFSRKAAPLLAAAVIFCGLALAGCDDHVEVIKDPEVLIQKGNTWAWRPQTDANPSGKKVLSRDVLTPNPDVDNSIVRDRLKIAIEKTLKDKGLVHVDDPSTADFLVDYHASVRGHRAVVAQPYPAVVCGPFGCWDSWGPGWGYWGPPAVRYQQIYFREGTIVFDFAKRSNNKLAFRAIGSRPVNRDSISQDALDDAMHGLLKQLKVKK